MGEDRVWKLLSLVLTGMLVVMGMTSLLLYSQLSATEEKYANTIESLDKLSYSIDLLMNYGNGTKIWRNNTRIPIGFNLYNVTVLITEGRMEATYYTQFQSHFINSIDGVGGAEDPDKITWAWIAWHFNEASERWEAYDVSADMVFPRDGDKIAWYYQDISKYPDYEPPN
ncbi:MAG: hypothetical protein ACE5KU_03410 [Nitrososphaerales archaeon]